MGSPLRQLGSDQPAGHLDVDWVYGVHSMDLAMAG